MNDSDDRVKAHYSSKSLPDSILKELVEHAQSVDPKLSPLGRVQNLIQSGWLRAAVVAAVLASVAVVVHKGGVHAERTDRALKEVAMNHSTRLDLEFVDPSIDSIDEQMVLLPFDVSLPERVSAHYKVKGARYCSMSGQLAVHIELTHPVSNNTLSVFMTRAADELDAIDSSDKSVDGIDVKIWRESGLLYAMVGSFESKEIIQ